MQSESPRYLTWFVVITLAVFAGSLLTILVRVSVVAAGVSLSLRQASAIWSADYRTGQAKLRAQRLKERRRRGFAVLARLEVVRFLFPVRSGDTTPSLPIPRRLALRLVSTAMLITVMLIQENINLASYLAPVGE